MRIKSLVFLTIAMTVIMSAAVKADISELASGNNEFAVDLYRKLGSREGNLFFSPYSISTALGMTYAGARGQTAEQMRQTLNFTIPDQSLPKAFAGLENQMERNRKTGGYELSVANSLWGQKGFSFLDEFMETLDKYYGAGLRVTDFRGDTEGSRRKINAWVEKKTNNRIEDLLAPGVLKPTTRLVLCNAIYFKGDWAEQFDKGKTKDQSFHHADGSESTVPMMHNKIKCLHVRGKQFQAIQLPYKGEDVSMLVLLPNQRDGLTGLEENLSPELLQKTVRDMRKREVRVQMPRFKMTSEFSLADTLSVMGMPAAFSAESANFSGMTGSRDLYIGAVVHKAFVEVNEEGTEAAAATAVVMMLRSMPAPTPLFRADHPFVFILRDNATGSILFMGRVSQP